MGLYTLLVHHAFFTIKAAEQEVFAQSSSAGRELLMYKVQDVTNLPHVLSSIIVNYVWSAEQEVFAQSSSAGRELLMYKVQDVTNLPHVLSSIIVNYVYDINRALMSLIEEQYIPSDEECTRAVQQQVRERYDKFQQKADADILEYYELRELDNKRILDAKEQSRMMELRVKEQMPYWKQVSLMVRLLCEQQPKILCKKRAEKTAQGVRVLLEQCADPNAPPDWFGDRPLSLAVGDDDKIGITRILLEHRARINEHDRTGDKWTPLHRAVIYNQIKTVRLLIENKAEVNRYNHRRGETPWQMAMNQTERREDIIELLEAAVLGRLLPQEVTVPVPFQPLVDREEKNNMEKRILETPKKVEEYTIKPLKYSALVVRDPEEKRGAQKTEALPQVKEQYIGSPVEIIAVEEGLLERALKTLGGLGGRFLTLEGW